MDAIRCDGVEVELHEHTLDVDRWDAQLKDAAARSERLDVYLRRVLAIVGSRMSKAPYDPAEQFETRGNHFADGQTIEAVRPMRAGRNARDRRVVHQWSFKRYQRDHRAINKMVERAEKVADGTRPLKKDRFVKFAGTATVVDWGLVERACYLAGLKGYVTNIPSAPWTARALSLPTTTCTRSSGPSGWPSPTSPPARFSTACASPSRHTRPSSSPRWPCSVRRKTRAGLSIRKILQTLRPLRSATIALNAPGVTTPPLTPDEVQRVIDLARGDL